MMNRVMPSRFFMKLPAVVFLVTFNLSFAGGLQAADVDGDTRRDSILVRKNSSSRHHKIGMFPDALQKVLFFTVKGNEGKVYQLYIFDLDGKLVTQKEIRNNQTTFIDDFTNGIYLFDVFCDDERIGNGQISVIRDKEQLVKTQNLL